MAILVGGSSSRMGQPKATIRLDHGELLLDQICDAVASLRLPVTLVGRGPITERAERIERIPDAPGIVGPLAGILAAMAHDADAAWLVLACDLPLVRKEGVQWLMNQRREEIRAIIPQLSDRRVEPLFALYEPESRDLLWTIAQSESPAPKRLITHDQVATPAPPRALHTCWTNINTPDELVALSAHRA